MTAFFGVYQIVDEYNSLKNNTLHDSCKISIFVHKFSETPKYSILRASALRDFNT